jgi:hypothetical protein
MSLSKKIIKEILFFNSGVIKGKPRKLGVPSKKSWQLKI